MDLARGTCLLFVCFVFGEVTLSNTFSMANKQIHMVSLPSTVGFESNQTRNVFKRSAILVPRAGKLQGHEPTGPMATSLVNSRASLLDSQRIATVSPSGSKIATKIPDKHVATKASVRIRPKKTTTEETTVETEETTTEVTTVETEETTVETEETTTEVTTVETEETTTEVTTVETEETTVETEETTEMTTEKTTVEMTTVQPTTVVTKREMSATTSSTLSVKGPSPRPKKSLSKTLAKEPKEAPLPKKSDETLSHPMNVVDHSQQKGPTLNTTQKESTAHNWKTPSKNNSDNTSSHPMNVVDHSQQKGTALHNTTQEGSTAHNWNTPSEDNSDKTSSHTMNVVDHPQQKDTAFHNITQEESGNCTTSSENISVDVKIRIELGRSNTSAAVINGTEDYFTTDVTPRHQKKRKVAGVILVVLISLSAACAILFVLMPSKHEHRPRDRVELLSARNRPRFYDTSLHMGH